MTIRGENRANRRGEKGRRKERREERGRRGKGKGERGKGEARGGKERQEERGRREKEERGKEKKKESLGKRREGRGPRGEGRSATRGPRAGSGHKSYDDVRVTMGTTTSTRHPSPLPFPFLSLLRKMGKPPTRPRWTLLLIHQPSDPVSPFLTPGDRRVIMCVRFSRVSSRRRIST